MTAASIQHRLHSEVELLSPAGDWDCLRAAVENGADAVYFGLDCGHNARARAKNFSVDDLKPNMEFVHLRGVRGYVTLNTLVFPSELSDVEGLLDKILAAHVDAVLVQDIGLAQLIRMHCPSLAIHASTQMTLTSAESLAVVGQLGIQRVVLPRELSIDEIAQIHEQASIELEAFVHGALCVAYSGQCLTSESLGNRSANRGQCAQACRLPYELICDGQDVPTGDVRYLLSPQDLAAYDHVPQLIAAGVRSFKIEGRLKAPEYVASITRRYRQVIDATLAGHPASISFGEKQEMELTFSRGFSPGWLEGCDHKRLVPGLSSAKRGIHIGHVHEVRDRSVTIDLQGPLSAGDGIVFAGDRAAGTEVGGRVFQLFQRRKPVRQEVSHGRVEVTLTTDTKQLRTLYPGQQVWKTDDPKLTRALRKTYSSPDPIRRVNVTLRIQARTGDPLVIEGFADNGGRCQFRSSEPLPLATKHAATADLFQTQLRRLGGTVYTLTHVDAEISGEPLVPLSVLGKARRSIVSQLNASAVDRSADRNTQTSTLADLQQSIRHRASGEIASTDGPVALRVTVRSLGQLRAALDHPLEGIYVDFQDIRQYREAVATAHDRGQSIFLASPRIQKPGEMGIFRAMSRHHADGFLVRNLSGLQFCREHDIPFVADYSLNVANELTADFIMSHQAQRVTASYDLNRDQLLELVTAVPPHWLEMVIHQHMPMFHMEHCVFCALLSPGTNKHNCGRPCDVHQVELRDRIGMEHPLVADIGCRNTLFNATPQSAAEAVPMLLDRGVRNYRIEFLNEDDQHVAQTIHLYRQLLNGEVTGRQVWNQLKASNRVGVTRGTLEERRNELAIL